MMLLKSSDISPRKPAIINADHSEHEIKPQHCTEEAISTEMNSFGFYVKELESYANAALSGEDSFVAKVNFHELLNGEVGAELRRRVPLTYRQEIGAFFTGENLRQIVFNSFPGDPIETALWDPACGAGDLLLTYAKRLPINTSIERTIKDWGKAIFGNDIEALFLRAAKSRLVLLAYARGARSKSKNKVTLENTFPNLIKRNSLTEKFTTPKANVVLNPPFVSIQADKNCEWGNGNVSAAAVFVEMCVKKSLPGTKIVAILPDVLRTGTRYAQWRSLINKHSDIEKIDIYGSFDPQADVDVFVLELTTKSSKNFSNAKDWTWGITDNAAIERIEHYFSISVGPVVPHRHKEVGEESPYLHARESPAWGMLEEISTRRRFSGRTHQPPFVVIRRTSSPSDRERAIGTIINCTEAVAVENHLIICKPHDNSLESCKILLETLKSNSTNEWLNSRIRCRHLTVGSIKEVPFLQANQKIGTDLVAHPQNLKGKKWREI